MVRRVRRARATGRCRADDDFRGEPQDLRGYEPPPRLVRAPRRARVGIRKHPPLLESKGFVCSYRTYHYLHVVIVLGVVVVSRIQWCILQRATHPSVRIGVTHVCYCMLPVIFALASLLLPAAVVVGQQCLTRNRAPVGATYNIFLLGGTIAQRRQPLFLQAFKADVLAESRLDCCYIFIIPGASGALYECQDAAHTECTPRTHLPYLGCTSFIV